MARPKAAMTARSAETSAQPCEDCGAPIGGRERCDKLFHQLIARDFSDALYFGSHRLLVDCYAMQHERYIHSYKSFAAHLTGLCCALEFADDAKLMRAIHLGLDGNVKGDRPPVPRDRGELTILSVIHAGGAARHHEAVRAWADSVWRAWSQQHELARTLLRELRIAAENTNREL